MEIPDSLMCLFTAQPERREGSVVIEVPDSEVRHGVVAPGETYEIALLSRPREESSGLDQTAPDQTAPDQPVQEGDVLEVEIEDIGDQGDGIARVGPGFVVIVSETELGDRVTVEITDVRDTVAFADVVDGDEPVV